MVGSDHVGALHQHERAGTRKHREAIGGGWVAFAALVSAYTADYEPERDFCERARNMATTGERMEPSAVTTPLLPRVIPLDGISNLRDVGGYPIAGGGRVREGLVFRSAALDRATRSDVQQIAALGLRTICDFRGVAEANAAPTRLELVPALERHALPIEPSVGASLRDIVATRAATGEDVATLMQRAYTAYALEFGQRYQALFELLLQEGRLPLLFHCSAGKDRTGFATALLLTALGVEWDVVMADYLATNRIWQGDSKLAASLPPEVADQFLRVDPDYLEAGFAALKREYGSVDRYLERSLGLAPRDRVRLASLLLA